MTLYGFRQFGSTVVLLCLLAGCTNVGGSDGAKNSSKLAGRWQISVKDLGASSERNLRHLEEAEVDLQIGIQMVTINRDGSFDWSRSHIGKSEGVHGLRDAGDQCVSRTSSDKHYLVDHAEYTPTMSRIELRRLASTHPTRRFQEASYSFEVELTEDDRAKLTVTRPIAGQKRLVLHRIERCPPLQQSVIAGSWSIENDPKIALIIRPDGTFDWSGTDDSLSTYIYQLECVGDRAISSDPRTVLEVIRVEYEPDKSVVILQLTNPLATGDYSQSYVAQGLEDGSLLFTVGITDGTASNEQAVRLVRNDQAVVRHTNWHSRLFPNPRLRKTQATD